MRLQAQALHLQVDSTLRCESLATQSGYAENFVHASSQYI